ncbi:hypothetical protein BD626DRAFT_576942 [Schizophyllum amplum]|uniref:Chromo domain-containing protein n=1 Tax=Schizophyllum amplum TaxID=97359 RepID=A0A550BSU6_9AGAR|nr:hypothetical protein BD626DRAFT_576942 [Auriculariopsis ampla]
MDPTTKLPQNSVDGAVCACPSPAQAELAVASQALVAGQEVALSPSTLTSQEEPTFVPAADAAGACIPLPAQRNNGLYTDPSSTSAIDKKLMVDTAIGEDSSTSDAEAKGNLPKDLSESPATSSPPNNSSAASVDVDMDSPTSIPTQSNHPSATSITADSEDKHTGQPEDSLASIPSVSSSFSLSRAPQSSDISPKERVRGPTTLSLEEHSVNENTSRPQKCDSVQVPSNEKLEPLREKGVTDFQESEGVTSPSANAEPSDIIDSKDEFCGENPAVDIVPGSQPSRRLRSISPLTESDDSSENNERIQLAAPQIAAEKPKVARGRPKKSKSGQGKPTVTTTSTGAKRKRASTPTQKNVALPTTTRRQSERLSAIKGGSGKTGSSKRARVEEPSLEAEISDDDVSMADATKQSSNKKGNAAQSVDTSDDGEFFVERIVGQRGEGQTTEFLVQWKDTWVPAKDVRHSTVLADWDLTRVGGARHVSGDTLTVGRYVILRLVGQDGYGDNAKYRAQWEESWEAYELVEPLEAYENWRSLRAPVREADSEVESVEI